MFICLFDDNVMFVSERQQRPWKNFETFNAFSSEIEFFQAFLLNTMLRN